MRRYWLFTGGCFALLALLFLATEAAGLPILRDPRPWLAEHSIAAGAIGVGLLLVDVALPVPSSAVMVAHGAIFGLWPGTLLSMIGSVGATLLSFGLGRAGNATIRRFVTPAEHERAGALLRRWGLLAIVVTRPVPLVAETVAILAGASPLSWAQVLLGAILGALPAALLYAAAGAMAVSTGSELLVLVVVLALAGLVFVIGQRLQAVKGIAAGCERCRAMLSWPHIETAVPIKEARMATTDELLATIRAGDAARVTEILRAAPELASQRPDNDASPLLLAIYYGRPAVVEAVRGSGVAPTIWEAAALGEHERVAELLAEQPTLVNTLSPDGFPPLGLAAFMGQQEAVELLLAHGAEVNVASHNPQRVMPLHGAVAGQHLLIANILLEHGAEPNALQADAFTPLHGAAQNGQLEMVQLLLRYGAAPNAHSSDGKTPLDLARAQQHQAVVGLLEQAPQPA